MQGNGNSEYLKTPMSLCRLSIHKLTKLLRYEFPLHMGMGYPFVIHAW